MGKLHKEIGQLIVQSAEDPEKSDSQVIQVTLSSSHGLSPQTVSLGSGWLSACCSRELGDNAWRGRGIAAQMRSAGPGEDKQPWPISC